MKLKYTIPLLSLATPLAAETNCLQDNNETPYEIISCLNKEIQQLKSELAKVKKNIFFMPFRDRLKDGSLGPEMVLIPAGSVDVKQFAMGKFEVTFAEYDKFAEATGRTKPNDEGWGRGNRPVINVSWYDATAYTEWLSQQTGYTYRLPTDASWEYAARAGTETHYWWGNGIGKNNANCNSAYNIDDFKYTSPVGFFSANPFGLYDTAGNVLEWTCSEYTKI